MSSRQYGPRCSGLNVLHILVLQRECFGIDGSIPWLQISRILASPGHQQPSYCLRSINNSLCSTRKNFNNLHNPTLGKSRQESIFRVPWIILNEQSLMWRVLLAAIPDHGALLWRQAKEEVQGWRLHPGHHGARNALLCLQVRLLQWILQPSPP